MATKTLLIDPAVEIAFDLSEAVASPNAVIKLQHPGGSNEPIAFKVRVLSDSQRFVWRRDGDKSFRVLDSVAFVFFCSRKISCSSLSCHR